MKKLSTDLCIIGAGPGGYVAAIYAKKQGLDVTLIDKEWIGGTCLNVGCIPTKTLVESANTFAKLKDNDLGIHFNDLSINLEEVIDRKNDVRDQLVSGIEFILKKNKVNYIEGEATFVNERQVSVNETLIEAKDIIIATGSKPKTLPIEGQALTLHSRELMDLKTLPKTLTIIGGGIIGMEFAFIYANMGVDVTVIEFLPRILPGIDKKLALRLMPYAKKAGIKIFTNSAATKIEEKDGLKHVFFNRKGKEQVIESDIVLEAVGREPVVQGLNLENSGVVFTQKTGIPVNAYMRTNQPHIYAIGDVNNIMQLAHVASHQALTAVDDILNQAKPFDKVNVPSVIFTSPPIATVGITEAMAKEEEIDIDITKVPFSSNGKAIILGGERGFMQLIRRRSDQVLIGAMIIGEAADHLIGPLTLAIKEKLKADDLYHTIFAHPTMEEIIHEAALGLDQLAIHYIE